MDGGGDQGAAETRQRDLGDGLEGLLDQLARSGLKVGPRERVAAAALVASLTASGAVRDFKDLAPLLAPLLARSPEERRSFHQVLAAYAPGSVSEAILDEHAQASAPTPVQQSRWWWPVAGLAVIAAGVVTAFVFWPAPPDIVKRPAQTYERSGGTFTPAPPIKESAEAAPSDSELLDRIIKAADRFEGAPTLDELSLPLARSARITGWPAESFALRLQELTGLPRAAPLPLYADDGAVLARIAHALERIERPGREPPLARFAAASAKLVAARKPETVYELAALLPDWLSGESPQDKDALIALIQRRLNSGLKGRDEAPTAAEAIDRFTVERALAITADPTVRRIYDDAPWLSPAAPGLAGAPWWARVLAAIAPLALAVLWLANSLAVRKAYLRRRPPALPPLHVDLVAEAAARVAFPAGLFRRIAQRLQRRSIRPSTHIDAAATIAATVRGGGEIVVPVFATTRHAPEYLVLIERRATGDQDAARLRDLVSRLDILVPITIFYFQGEPSMLEPEKSGRPVPIERLQAQFADHRLLILGAGAELLDPATLKPHASAAKLRHWPERALLTPLPIAEWGREEFALASELDMPVGRATPEGLLALAEAIGRESDDREDLLDTRGDGLARPLPDVLRVRPQRFLYSTPPGDVPVPVMLQHLRNFLDGPGFEWLAALAIYPAVQWDLTLFLGVSLPERAGADGTAPRLYREDRIAALTQLPWLREGKMPDWLRRALIETLEPKRAGEIRAALQRLLKAAELTGDRAHDEAVKLRIAQEPAKDRVPASELLEDEVLIDFLARGRIEDFALPRSSLLDAVLPRGLLDRFGIPELSAGVVALLYALAAWWLAPAPGDGALLTGAWLPLAVLALGGAFALAIAEPRATYQVLHRGLIRLGPVALAFALLAPLLAIRGHVAVVQTIGRPLWLPWLGEAVALALAAAALAAGLRVGRWMLRIAAPEPRARWVELVNRVAAALVLLIATHFVVEYVTATGSLEPWNVGVRLTLAGSAVFLAAFLGRRLLPPRLPPPRAAPIRGRRAWSVTGGMVKASVALLPIVPAVWLTHMITGASQLLKPMPGGVTAMAEAPDHSYLALGGVDGRVRVYQRRDGRLEPEPRIIEPKTRTGTVTSLALRFEGDDPSKPLVLAVGSADGAVRLYDGTGGSERPLPKSIEAVRSQAAPPLVALLPGGSIAAAVEDADGSGQIVTESGALTLGDSGPVSALAAIGPGILAVATLDGQVRLVTSEAAYPPRLVANEGVARRLPGRARKLLFDPAGQRLNAIGDDGSVLTARLDGGSLREFALSDTKLAAMSLGPAVRFERKAGPASGKRIALVVGNSRYDMFAALRTPGRDAEAVAASLARLGFDVRVRRDVSNADLSTALAAFGAEASGADVALFYFSGHSFSVEGRNYLAAIDTSGVQAAGVPAGATAVESATGAVAAARSLRMVFVDASNQVGNQPRSRGSIAPPKSQTPVRLPPGTIVGYASQEGAAAQDVLEGKDTSPYTSAFVRALDNPDRDIRDLHDEVRRAVMTATQGRQRPIVYSTLSTDPITILGTRPTAPRDPAPPTASPAEPKQEFSTVRVYYGTDREIADTTATEKAKQPSTRGLVSPPAPAPGRATLDSDSKRLQFSSRRGRRLTVGSVVVGVPQSRSVPSIERPWALKIPTIDLKIYEEKEDPSKHFTIRSIDVRQSIGNALSSSPGGIVQTVAGGQALLFIHGYNTTFDNAIYRTAQIASDIRFEGSVFAYSWPSASTLAGYTFDRESAAQAEPYLRQFLEQIAGIAGAGRINVIAHGMGVEPLLRVLREVQGSSAGPPLLNELILAAPDADRDTFQSAMAALTRAGVARGVTLYVASNDLALESARRFWGGISRAGEVPATGPIVVPGVDTIDVTAVSTETFGLNYSNYAENNVLVGDIRELIATGMRPPERRNLKLQKVEGPTGVYWRYPAAANK